MKRISSNYSCINCCGNSFYDGWITPGPTVGFAGEEMQITAMQQDMNCYGHTFPPFPAWATFSAAAPSICDPSSGSTILFAPGQTSIYGVWRVDSWSPGVGGYCEYSGADILRDALCEVLDTVQLHNVTVFERAAPFGFGNIAQLSLQGSPHESETCGSNPSTPFEIRVHFQLPEGATLVPECCNAEPIGDVPQWIVTRPITCVRSGAGQQTGRLVFGAYRAVNDDNRAGIKVFVGAEDQNGHRKEVSGTVNLTCTR